MGEGRLFFSPQEFIGCAQMGDDVAVPVARVHQVDYDLLDVVYRSGGDKYDKDRQARKALQRGKSVGKTASRICREMLDEYSVSGLKQFGSEMSGCLACPVSPNRGADREGCL